MPMFVPDEPASELFKRFVAEKAKIAEQAKISQGNGQRNYRISQI